MKLEQIENTSDKVSESTLSVSKASLRDVTLNLVSDYLSSTDSDVSDNVRILKMIGYDLDIKGNRAIIKKKSIEEDKKEDDDPCWKGYRQLGMKDKNGKQVPNCVKDE